MTTQTVIQRPADLDPTKLHTPDEYRRWKAEMYAYHEAIRNEAQRQRMKEEAANAHANRLLSTDEYYALSVEREAEKQAREAEHAAARQKEQDAKAAYLISSPDVAEVSERSEFLFLQGVVQWAGRGYTLGDDGITAFLPGFYSVRMTKPATAAKKTK